jgi:NADH-quinone oxidoreductase subunit A
MDLLIDTLPSLLGDYKAIHNYLPILVFIIFAIAFAIGGLIFSYLIRPNKPDPEKLSPYECGIPPMTDARERFSIRFFIIAMLFLLFDVEAVFLYPWAVVYNKIGLYGLIEMMLFIGILLVGYVYAWRKGALEWE